MPEHEVLKPVTRWRVLGAFAAAAVVAAAATLSGSVAQGRVDPLAQEQTGPDLSPDTIGLVTGGGTVKFGVAPNEILASFGINGKRPPGFTPPGTNGAAQGRINYDRHAQVVGGRHVNVPVTFMQVELSTTPSQNGTGGKAQLIGDCRVAGTECPTTPPGIQSVLVYVEDNSDIGTGDVFQISFCTDVPSASPNPAFCGAAEGGPIRTGNIQIRASAGGSPQAPTAAQAPRLRP